MSPHNALERDPCPNEKPYHPLDRVVWEALRTRQSYLALGNELARRYPARIAPFAAMADTSMDCFQALASLVPPGDRVALFTLDEVLPPAPFKVQRRDVVDQMIWTTAGAPVGSATIESLGPADVPDMIALVQLTQPGPFGPETHKLGSYFGIYSNGQLIAMAGERMRLNGFTEISAVCVHPSHRGQGCAAALVNTLAKVISDREEIPFLHVSSGNPTAQALYRKLGFSLRRKLQLAVLERSVG